MLVGQHGDVSTGGWIGKAEIDTGPFLGALTQEFTFQVTREGEARTDDKDQ